MPAVFRALHTVRGKAHAQRASKLACRASPQSETSTSCFLRASPSHAACIHSLQSFAASAPYCHLTAAVPIQLPSSHSLQFAPPIFPLRRCDSFPRSLLSCRRWRRSRMSRFTPGCFPRASRPMPSSRCVHGLPPLQYAASARNPAGN